MPHGDRWCTGAASRAGQGRAGQGRAGQGRAGHLSDAMTGRQVLRSNGHLDRVAQELRSKLLNGGRPRGGEHEGVSVCTCLLSNGPARKKKRWNAGLQQQAVLTKTRESRVACAVMSYGALPGAI